MNKRKIAFVHGRPAPHDRNSALVKKFNADFFLVDKYLRYHDLKTGRLRRYLSFLLNAFFSPSRKYDIIITLGVLFPPLLRRFFGLFPRKRKKIIGLLVGEELYFLYTRYYSKFTSRMMYHSILQFDALICKGQMQLDLAEKIFGDKCPKLYKILNGLSEEKHRRLSEVKPSLESYSIISVIHGPGGFRVWYKGLDTMLKAFVIARNKLPQLTFNIIGIWEKNTVENLLADNNIRDGVHFLGPKKFDDICQAFSQSSLFLLCSRGDCFPNATLESMAAGVTPMVSDWTGTKEIIEQVDPQLITSTGEQVLADRLVWYFRLSPEERQRLSDKSREVISKYTETANIAMFEKALRDALN